MEKSRERRGWEKDGRRAEKREGRVCDMVLGVEILHKTSSSVVYVVSSITMRGMKTMMEIIMSVIMLGVGSTMADKTLPW